MRSDQKRVIAYVKSLRAAGVSSVITLYAIRDLSEDKRRSILKVVPSR